MRLLGAKIINQFDMDAAPMVAVFPDFMADVYLFGDNYRLHQTLDLKKDASDFSIDIDQTSGKVTLFNYILMLVALVVAAILILQKKSNYKTNRKV